MNIVSMEKQLVQLRRDAKAAMMQIVSEWCQASTSYRLSHIKFHKARGRRLYCHTPTTDNAVKFNM